MVAEEEEFRAARWDNRFADGFPWPVSQMTVPRRDEQRAKRRARRASRRASNKLDQSSSSNENGHTQNANGLSGNSLNGNGLGEHVQNSHNNYNGNDRRD